MGRRVVACALAAAMLAACSGGESDGDDRAGGETPSALGPSQAWLEKRYAGTLYLESNDPMEAAQLLSVDMRTGRFGVVANGVEPASWGGDLAFVEYCSALAVKLSIQDSDGFTSPISECVELDLITPDFFAPQISPDGTLVAVTNTAIPSPAEPGQSALDMWAAGTATYAGTQVYDRQGRLVQEFRDLGPATWTRSGDFVLAGLGGETVGFGLFRADMDNGTARRIDDGRLQGPVTALDAHPKADRIAFIHCGALFEMALSDGAPKRTHAHGVPLAGLAYSPDGNAIAFVSADPLDEGIYTEGDGYPVHVFENGTVHEVRFPFIPGGPLAWVD